MFRETIELAEQTERLMGECGYRHTDIRHAASMGEIWDFNERTAK